MSDRKSRTIKARQAAARASRPVDQRQPREAPLLTQPTSERSQSRHKDHQTLSREHPTERRGRRRMGTAANDGNDALDDAARDAMGAGDPPALPHAPTLTRSRDE